MLSGGVDFRHPKFNHDELLSFGFQFEKGVRGRWDDSTKIYLQGKHDTYTLTFKVSDYTFDLVLMFRQTCWWVWIFKDGLGCMFNSYTKNLPIGVPDDDFPLIESVVYEYTNDGY